MYVAISFKSNITHTTHQHRKSSILSAMFVLVKSRFLRKWIFICIIVLVFVLGNFVLYNSYERNVKPVKSNWPNTVDTPVHYTEEVTPAIAYTLGRENTKGKPNGKHAGEEFAVATPLPKSINHVEGKGVATENNNFKYKIAVLIIACNRPSVSRCLDQIFKFRPENFEIPVIVSQDCGHAETETVIQSYGDKLTLVKQPELSSVPGVPGHMQHFMGYYKISRHYKFALQQAFKDPKIDSVIIVEDDLNIAPDFFEYFIATRPLLDQDISLFCVSAWNDNGKEGFVKDNKQLYRTDFFPGLGWMLTRRLWQELEPKWPLGFWDDWMRNTDQRKNRACIRPEISRSKTFGRIGVSQGQFFDQHLKFIELNQDFVPFSKTDLSYLLKANYDTDFLKEVKSKPVVSAEDVLNNSFQGDTVRILYSSRPEIESLLRQFGLMTDFKAGVPRTAYKGIISFIRNNKRIYLTPTADWAGYSES